VERALQLADNMTRRQAAKAGGLVWEHYDENWEIDWDYNLDDPKHLFRPWGFQPGHQTEWAKLLLILDRHVQADWLVPTAQHLFDVAVARSWDEGARWPVLQFRTGIAPAAGHGRCPDPATVSSATMTSTSGCRPRRWPRPR
jgi:mannose/cellobiose epimerase-like protein (N-acyl-D-glucosamine 2-epimerase family)